MDELKVKQEIRVAVVMATYNPNLEFFKEQIQSLKSQTFTNWKCYISDDLSEDDIFHSMKKIVADDSRFVLTSHEKPCGTPFNFENALKQVSTDVSFIAFCDQDDVWEPNKLEELLIHFKDPQVMVVHSDLSLIDSKGLKIAESCWKAEGREFQHKELFELLLRNNVTGCSMMFRQGLMKCILPFPLQPRVPYYYHDHWVALHGLLKGEIKAIHQPLVRYRQHSNNVIGAHLKAKVGLLRKLLNFRSIMKKSVQAYKQRQAIYNDLTSYNSNARTELLIWQAGFPAFAMYLVRRAIITPQMRPLTVQLIIGYVLINFFPRYSQNI